jgi:hypothetical protein
LVLNILLHVSALYNAVIRESNTILLREVPNVVGKQRRMGAVYCNRWRDGEE